MATPELETTTPAETTPIQRVFRHRAGRALEEISNLLGGEAREEAARERSDFDVLLRAMEACVQRVPLTDPLASARIEGMKATRRLMDRLGTLLPTSDVAATLSMSTTAVQKKRAKGYLLAIRDGGQWRFPAWQFKDGDVVDGLRETLDALSDESLWVKLRFFVTPNSVLMDETPIDLLRLGETEVIVKAAQAYGDQGGI